MKTTIINKSTRIQRIPVAILLIALLSPVVFTVSAQEDGYAMNGLSYKYILTQTDSKIMDHINKVRSIKNAAAVKDNIQAAENAMRIPTESKENLTEENLVPADLELENWMKNLSEFLDSFEKRDQKKMTLQSNLSRETIKKMESGLEIVLDESLELERWMLRLSDWDLIKYENVGEPEPELESWMIDLSEWD